MSQETTSIENEDNDKMSEIEENDEEFDLDGEVDLEGELICALNEIEKLIRKNKLLKEKRSQNSNPNFQIEEQQKN